MWTVPQRKKSLPEPRSAGAGEINPGIEAEIIPAGVESFVSRDFSKFRWRISMSVFDIFHFLHIVKPPYCSKNRIF